MRAVSVFEFKLTLIDDVNVVLHAVAVVLVVVYEMYFVFVDLNEPDSCSVPNAQIPACVDWVQIDKRKVAYAIFFSADS